MDIYSFAAANFWPDQFSQLNAGDIACQIKRDTSRGDTIRFDDTNAMSAIGHPILGVSFTAPVTAVVKCYVDTTSTDDFGVELFIESVGPGDPINLIAGEVNWGGANAGKASGTGSIGAPLTISIPITDFGGWAAGRLLRLGVRRDPTIANNGAGFLYIEEISVSDAA